MLEELLVFPATVLLLETVLLDESVLELLDELLFVRLLELLLLSDDELFELAELAVWLELDELFVRLLVL